MYYFTNVFIFLLSGKGIGIEEGIEKESEKILMDYLPINIFK